MHGTAELKTERLRLRRHISADADILYEKLGLDPAFRNASGWNPYATVTQARETVSNFMNSYGDPCFYGWAIEYQGMLIGTAGAYDYDCKTGSIEIGYSIIEDYRGRGFASEAVSSVLNYLTEVEGIRRVTAWCSADNTASQRVLERTGMKLVSVERESLFICGQKHDRLNFEYYKEK